MGLAALSMYDYIIAEIEAGKCQISLEEFTKMMQEGTPEDKKKAVEKMLAAGGYEALI